jgi:chromosome segregation ATPase
MSEAQRQSIIKLQNEYRVTERKDWRVGSPFSIKSDYTQTPEGTLTYRVYGVSEGDTRKMAEGVIEWLDNQALERLEDFQKRLDRDQNTVAEAEKVLPKLRLEIEQLTKQVDELKEEYSEANYGIDQQNIAEHVKSNMEELAHKLRDADFELVGLEARIDLIGKFKAGGKITDQATMIKLNQMLITDEIERAGVLARRSAYEAAFKLTKGFYDAFTTLGKVSAQKEHLETSLAHAKNNTSMWEEILADPKPEMRPVQVYENKVIIHPVRTDDDKSNG